MELTQSQHNHSGAIVILLLVFCGFTVMDIVDAVWFNHGGDLSNSRSRSIEEPLINPLLISKLRLKWKFFTGDDTTATPAVAHGVVYFPSWNGYLYAVNAFSGALVWRQHLGELTGLSPAGVVVNVTVSRTAPVIAGHLLIIGIYGPAVVVAINRFSGALVWSTVLDTRPRSQITTSGTPYLGGFYVGVSSLEVTLPAEQCCTFRGSMAKLDIQTGAVLWRTYTIPDNGGKLGGYSGAAIWGSSPAIDTKRNLVYIGTGNLYNAPAEVQQCQASRNNQTIPSQPDQCIAPDVHFDSILALELDSGKIRWFRQFGGYDVFYFVCLVPNNPACPTGPNLDADFGEAPMLLTIFPNGTRRDVVVALAGPGGLEGGGVWGAATDGKRVYTNIVNNAGVRFRLAPSNQTTTFGAWVALDANTGEIVWSTANPSNETAHGPVTVTNGVVFAGSVAPSGPFYAMDAETGTIIWTYNTNATVYGGASVSYGCVYLGHGYSVSLARFHPTWTRGNSVFAFCTV
ncbi:polyvinylalcohol dehydrogenase-like [Vitis riparia]|uniref:polyvinylalcohol dehydrogenase-like n=1 Tax=Vitis riparia TaxID=96939 RepID=UPI00155A5A78|nr:polyvinylalcohol dehydrogenase-like [Vitis riparia]